MTTPLKPYPKMKDSGVEWLGEVPEHWENRKLRTVLRSVSERNCPDLPLLSVVREKGVIVRDVSSQDENHNYIPDDLSNYKVVRIGQFAMNKMKAWQGSYGVSRFEGIVSPAYFVFDLNNVEGVFFNTAIRSKTYIPFFIQASDGVRIGQSDLSQARMREIPFALPPLPEQTAIVRYLDYMDRRIRRLIRAKRKLITLLNEQKQVIIHHAVTRGLDPDVPLKDSGVEWLGMVPEHWEVLRCGQIIYLTTGFPFKSEGFTQEEEDIRLLRGINISPGSIRWDEVVRWSSKERYLFEKFELTLDDIVLGMDRPIIGAGIRVAQARKKDLPCLLLQRVARIRPRTNLDMTFFLHILAGKSFRDYLYPIFTGISVPHLSPEQIRSFRIALPPLTEQAAIVEYLDQATSTLDTTITRAQREIDLLTEYRTRLIADVVTGKVDVREVAAGLPEVDPLGGVDEAVDGVGGDVEDEDGGVEGLAEEVEA